MLNWLHKIIFSALLVGVSLLTTSAFAEVAPTPVAAAASIQQVIPTIGQIDLLKNRLSQSRSDYAELQRQLEKKSAALTPSHVNKQLLDQLNFDITIAKSNLDSINIELSDSQQNIYRLEKEIQELENQLTVFNIFGLKIARNGIPNQSSLQTDLSSQKTQLDLERTRYNYLTKIQHIAENSLQLYSMQYANIEMLLKSQTLIQLKAQQAKSEVDLQQQQNNWLQRLNALNQQLMHTQNKTVDNNLENQIFYAKEHANLTYLQMLAARYQDEIQQLQAATTRSSSISLFNRVNDQAESLNKQLQHLKTVYTDRINILKKQKDFFHQEKTDLADNDSLTNQYQNMLINLDDLNQQLTVLKQTVSKGLQQELASRQGLPGLGKKMWLGLGNEILLVPTLTFQIVKSLAFTLVKTITNLTYLWWAVFCALEIVWVFVFYFFYQFLSNRLLLLKDHELGHVNLRWLLLKVLQRCLIDFALVGNIYWAFSLAGIPAQNFRFLINLGLVWLLFKFIITSLRLSLVETMHDRTGRDVAVYYRLRNILFLGGLITAAAVFLRELPLIYVVKDFSNRLFLLFLLIISVFMLRHWNLLPSLILPHIDYQRTYYKRIVRALALLIPLIFLVDSVIGLFGFFNLVLTISWYESVFLIVLFIYVVMRGLLSEAMEFFSRLLIAHVNNGWLWTEAFLKPVDKLLKVILFFSAWVALFFIYGWNQQSPVVERLKILMHLHLFTFLNTTFTPISIILIAVLISFLYWTARWTREFVYRFLLSRTTDSGVRNSIAILSQYMMIVVGVLISLSVLGIDLKALAVVATGFSVAVGLGLRDLANNFACGFLLLIERPVRVGDIVSINGYEGEVTHIGGRAVTIRTWDHMEVLVPNAEIFSKSFVNWTAKDNIVRSIISIKVNRHDRPHEVQALIYDVLAQHKDVLKDPAPEVFLKEMSEGLSEFEVRYYINLRLVKSRIGLRSEVLFAIWEVFEKNGIQPPYPHQEIYLKTGPAPAVE